MYASLYLWNKVKTFITVYKGLPSWSSLCLPFVVQSLSCVWFYVTSWTAAFQAPLSFTSSWSLLKFMSIESIMLSKHLILQTAAQLHSSHTLDKWCSKFSKRGFNSTWTRNFQMFKLDLEKAEEPEIKLLTSAGSWKKQESSRKNLLLLYWLHQNLWLYGSQQTVENS